MQRVHIEGLTRQGWSEAPTSPSNSQQPCQIMRAGSFCRLSKAPVGVGRSARLLRSQTGADTVRPGSSRQPPQIRTSERFFFFLFFLPLTFSLGFYLTLTQPRSAPPRLRPSSGQPPVSGNAASSRSSTVFSPTIGLVVSQRTSLPELLPR